MFLICNGDRMKIRFVAGFIIFLAVLLLFSYGATASVEARHTWNYIISDVPAIGPQYPSMGVGDDGKIWVAYMDESDHKYVNVTWYNGNTWHNDMLYKGDFVLVGNAVGTPPISLSVVGNVPHVFYYTYENNGLEGSLNHSYYENGAWHTETVWHGALTDNSGRPVDTISSGYIDGEFYVLFQVFGVNYMTNPENALYLVRGTTGSWGTPLRVIIGDGYHMFFGDLAIYNSSKIGISIYDEFHSTSVGGKIYYLLYTEYNGDNFTQIENITSETDDYMARIAFNSAGSPEIFYGKTVGSAGETYLMEYVRNADGTWTGTYVDQRENSPGGPIDAALAPNGDIVIAYNIDGQSGIQFSEYSNGAWNLEELDDTLSGNAGGNVPSIAFDSSGNIYVAYVNWNAERTDNYYIVVATTSSEVPEFNVYLPLLSAIAVISIFIYKHRK